MYRAIHCYTGPYKAIQNYKELYTAIAITIQFASDLFVPERRRIRHIKNEIKGVELSEE